MATTAKLSHARISPQKARLIADQIRGMPVDQAVSLLTFSNKKGAAIIKKVLLSAIANAEHNDAADVDALTVERITIDEASTIKRWRPRARGRASKIFKRSSHVTVVVEDASQ